MLVPAMAFAWWLVSMPSAARHPSAAGDESASAAQAATQTHQQDTQDQGGAADPTTGSAESEESTSGERVPVKLVTPEIVRVAKSFLDLPMGAERAVVLSGRRYVFVLERHFHPANFVGGPHGWHKGVTVYEMK